MCDPTKERVMQATDWYEFQLRYKPGYQYNPDGMFAFKQKMLMPLLDRLGVSYAFILDEPEYVLVRLKLNSEEAREEARKGLEGVVAASLEFSALTVDRWSPEADARNRIQAALGRLSAVAQLPTDFKGPGWQIMGRVPSGALAGSLIIKDQDLDEKVAEFAAFISEVAGQFTLAYLRTMPGRVQDRWLKSLFVHLLLNSISTPNMPNGGEEQEIREFPAI
jgi:hypothetical protein